MEHPSTMAASHTGPTNDPASRSLHRTPSADSLHGNSVTPTAPSSHRPSPSLDHRRPYFYPPHQILPPSPHYYGAPGYHAVQVPVASAAARPPSSVHSLYNSRPQSRASVPIQYVPYPIVPSPAVVRPDLPQFYLPQPPIVHAPLQHVRQQPQYPTSSRHSGVSVAGSRHSSRHSRDVVRSQTSHQNLGWHSDSSPDSFGTSIASPSTARGEVKSIFSQPDSIHRTSRPMASSRDLEKEFLSSHSPPSSHASLNQIRTYSEDDDETEEQDDRQRQTALKALFNLGFLAPFLSVVLTFYTFVIVTFSIFQWPVARCLKNSNTLSETIRLRLASAIRLQLKTVFRTPSAQAVLPASSSSRGKTRFPSYARSARIMIIVLMLAPIVVLPLALASWVVAGFWLMNYLIADEGNGKGDGHGMSATLVDWWTFWLRGMAFYG